MAVELGSAYGTIEIDTSGLQASVKQAQRAMGNLEKSANSMGRRLRSVGDTMASVGKAMTMRVTMPIVGLGAAVTKVGIDFESAFAGVRKTVDATEEEFAQLRAGFRKMATDSESVVSGLSNAHGQLTKIGELAGQLGVQGVDNILKFTDVIAQLGMTTALSTEEGATSLARFSNITQMSMENIDRLGSVVVDLGNNLATTEPEIVAMGLRLAGAGQIVGLTEAEIMGLAGALSSVGIMAQMGGTAFSRVIVEMQNAVKGMGGAVIDNSKEINAYEQDLTQLTGKLVELEYKTGLSADQLRAQHDQFIAAGHSAEEWGRQLGDKNIRALWEYIVKIDETKAAIGGLQAAHGKLAETDLSQWAEVAGMSVENFRQLFEEDAAEAIITFVEGLKRIQDEGGNVFQVLDDLGLGNIRVRDALLRSAGAGDLMRQSIERATDAWGENTALTEEARKRYETTQSQINAFVNSMKDIGITIADVVLPPLNAFLQNTLHPFISTLRERLSPEMTKWIVALAGAAAALGPLLVIGGKAVAMFAALANPVGVAALAIGGLVAAWSGGFDEVRGIIDKVAPDVSERIRELGQRAGSSIRDALPKIKARLGEWAEAFVAWVGPKISPLLAKLGELASRVRAWLSEQIPKLVTRLTEWGRAFVDWVAPRIPALLAKLEELANRVLAWLGEKLPELGAKLLEWGTAFVEWVGPKIPPLIVELGKLLGKVLAWMIGTALPKIVQKTIEWGGAFVKWVATEAIPKIVPALFNFLWTVTDWIATDAVPAIIEAAWEIGEGLVEGIGEGLESMRGWLRDKVQRLIDLIPSWLRDFLGIGSPARLTIPFGRALTEGLAAGITEGVGDLLDSFEDLIRRFVDLCTEMAEQGMGPAIERAEDFAGAFSAMLRVLQDLADTLATITGMEPYDLGNLDQLLQDLYDFVVAFQEKVTEALRNAGLQNEVERAGKMARDISAIIRVIADALAELPGIGSFVAPAEAAVDAFVASVGRIIHKFVEAVNAWEAENVLQAGTLAESLAAIFAPLMAAVDFLVRLGELKGLLIIGNVLDTIETVLREAYGIMQRLMGSLTNINRIGEPIAGSMEKFAVTLAALFAPLNEALDFVLKLDEVSKEFYSNVRARFRIMTEGFRVLETALREAWNVMRRLAEDLLSNAVATGERMTPDLKKFAETIAAFFGPLNAALDFVIHLSDLSEEFYSNTRVYFRIMTEGFNVLETVLRKVWNVMQGLATRFLPNWDEAAKDMLEKLDAFADTLSKLFTPINQAVDFLKEIGGEGFEELLAGFERIGEVLPRIEEAAKDVLEMMIRLADDILTDWQEGASDIKDRLDGMSESVNEAFDAMGSVVGAFSGLIDLLWDMASLAGTAQLEEEDWAGLAWAITRFFQSVEFALARALAAAEAFDPTVVETAATKINRIGEAMAAMAEAFARIVEEAMPTEEAMAGFLMALIVFQAELQAAIAQIDIMLREPPFADISWYGIGANLINSLTAGLQSGMGALAATMSEIASLMQVAGSTQAPNYAFAYERGARGAVPSVASVNKEFNINTYYPPNQPVDIQRQIELAKLREKYG